jgi:hypothetical protein
MIADAAGHNADLSGALNYNPTGILQIDTIPPSALTISAASDSGASPVTAGHVVTIAVNASENVVVNGTPALELNDNEVATYQSGSGTSTLKFAYIVQLGDVVSDLKVTGLNVSVGSAIQDLAGNLLDQVTGDLGLQIGVTPASIQNDYFAITRTPLPLDQATATAGAINAGAQTETQYINSLLVQVANTTIPAIAVEATMYNAVGTSDEVTLLATQFLPGQVAYATQHGFNPQVFATEVLGLTFAFGNEVGGDLFAANYGPANSAVPNTVAGDASFAAMAATAVYGSASTANLINVLETWVGNWKSFYSSHGIPGIASASADQIDLAARGAAWGDAVGVAINNNLGPLLGQVVNFLEHAAQGTALYSTSLTSQPGNAAFAGGVVASEAVAVTGVAAHLDLGLS